MTTISTSGSCGGRIDDLSHFRDLGRWKAADLGVPADDRLVFGQIDTERLVIRDIALQFASNHVRNVAAIRWLSDSSPSGRPLALTRKKGGAHHTTAIMRGGATPHPARSLRELRVALLAGSVSLRSGG